MKDFNTNIGITEYKLNEDTKHITGWLVHRNGISDEWSDPAIDGVLYDSSYSDLVRTVHDEVVHIRLDTGYFVQLIKPKEDFKMWMHDTLGIREYRKNPNTRMVTGVLYKKDERTNEWKEIGQHSFIEVARKEQNNKTTVITESGTYIDILD